jgi:hypothetical protein
MIYIGKWLVFSPIFRRAMAASASMTGGFFWIIVVNCKGLRWRRAPRKYAPEKTLYNRWKRMRRIPGTRFLSMKSAPNWMGRPRHSLVNAAFTNHESRERKKARIIGPVKR